MGVVTVSFLKIDVPPLKLAYLKRMGNFAIFYVTLKCVNGITYTVCAELGCFYRETMVQHSLGTLNVVPVVIQTEGNVFCLILFLSLSHCLGIDDISVVLDSSVFRYLYFILVYCSIEIVSLTSVIGI